MGMEGRGEESLVAGPLFSVLLGKLLGILHELLLVSGVLLRQVAPQGMVGLRLVDQVDQGLDHLLRLGRWLPVLHRHDGQADLTFLIHIWVVDFGLTKKNSVKDSIVQ